jgi:peptidoglycan/xylan/chitin deacetylase (PgdA/CDA1 family)
MTPRRRACLVGACVFSVLGGALSQPLGGQDRGPGITTARVAAVEPTGSPSASASPARPAAGASPRRRARTAPPRAIRPPSEVRIPVLYYHRVQAPPAGFTSWSPKRQREFTTYDVIPGAFDAQLDWLAEHGYTTILPRDLAAHWDDGAELPQRPVIITLDDGSHDWVSTVLPRLQAHHMIAEFYLTLDAIRWGAITWAEVRALAAAGNGIGAHDVHHIQLTRRGTGRPPASAAVMWSEVDGARRTIASETGVAPDSMAYVGGGFDPTLEDLVQKAGYTTARSIMRGVVQSADRRFEMSVVRIGSHDDVSTFASGRLVAGMPTFAARMRGVSDIPATTTGNREMATAAPIAPAERSTTSSPTGPVFAGKR